jgi:hypothetical protein
MTNNMNGIVAGVGIALCFIAPPFGIGILAVLIGAPILSALIKLPREAREIAAREAAWSREFNRKGN